MIAENVATKIETDKRTSMIVLTGRQIAEMVLREHGIPVGNRDVHVTFDVPGKRGQSNQAIHVSTRCPITVTWTEDMKGS
jgi:hypothetical protein